MSSVLHKQPSESLLLDLPAGPRMRSGDTISSVTSVTAEEVSGRVSTLTITGIVASGTTVQARYEGGADGDRYLIEAICETDGGDTVETDGLLYVHD